MNSKFSPYRLDQVTCNYDNLRVPVKKADRKPGKFPYYGASGIVDYVDNYLFSGDYLLISEDGENLNSRKQSIAFMASGKFWVNNHAHILQGNDLADTRYLAYYIENMDIKPYLSGSTRPKITKSSLNSIELVLPQIEIQKYIVGILGTLDDKIELNHKMNETLEAMAKAIFKSRFVDFDTVHAKMEGRQPFGMDAETAALFPDSFEDSKLGLIPKGWGVGKLGGFINLHRNSITPGKFPDESYHHYSIPAYDDGKLPKTEFGVDIKSNKYLMFPGCAYISKLNPRIPRIWFPDLDNKKQSICSTEFLMIESKIKGTIEFVYSLLASNEFQTEYTGMVTGSTGSTNV